MRRTLSVGNPIELDGTDGVPAWTVEAGRIDVFAIVERDGVAIGNRSFICSAGPGDMVFAMDRIIVRDVECRLRAFTGAGATLVPADFLGPNTEAAVDLWLGAFCHAVTAAHAQREAGGIAILPGNEITVTADVNVTAGQGVVWVMAADGPVLLYGEDELVFGAGVPVPLTAGSWVAARGDLSIVGADTATVLKDEGWLGHLAAFHRSSLHMLNRNLLVAFAAESRRVADSIARSRQAYTLAVSGFDQVLAKPVKGTPPAHFEDPLTACCRAVADALGFTMPVKPASKGAPPAGLLERIVRHSGMPAREVTLYGSWWKDELGPMIATVRETGAPVALLPGKRGRYTVHDPLTGQSEALDEHHANQLSPTAYVLYPTLPDRPLGVWDLISFGLAPSGGDLGLILLMSVLGALLALAVPTAVGILIDDLIPSHLKPQLVELAALLVMIAATQMMMNVATGMAQLRVFARAGTRLQTAVVDRALRLSSSFLSQFTSSDLSQRVSVVDTLRHAFGGIVVESMLAGIFSLSSLAYLLFLSPMAALAAFGLFLLFFGASIWAGVAQVSAVTENVAANAGATQLAMQFIQNIAQLRAAGAEERAYGRWAALYAKTQASALRRNTIVNRFAAFTAGYQVFALAVFFGVIALVRAPNDSTGNLLIMIATFAQFVGTSAGLGNAMQVVFLNVPGFRRAQVLLRAVPEVDASKADPGQLSGRIEVSHLTFGYIDGAPPVLNDVSLTIEPGQMVAFVGGSGCGKSTMMKLLLGFLTPQMGSIYYDGHDLAKIDLRAVRRQIGVVLQEGKLAAGSIADNILGVFGGTSDDAWEAARRAGFAEDIESMPMGMHTVLTDGATTLSGGQAQRLLIARALVSRPRVMFLDEATSALDNRTQATVTQSLQQMAGTRIVIAHRLTTIERADCIYVFEAGRIVQSGSYQELVGVPGLFADLAKRQTAD